MRPLLLVTGTGTEIGKTFVATALVRAWAADGKRIAGVKPVESGVVGEAADVSALARASTFALPFPAPYLFAAPVSPHLAARAEGRKISLDVIAAWVDGIRMAADGTVLELPGGLFSPLTDVETNADLAVRIHPTFAVLVTCDRLGVLHDVQAATRAAEPMGLRFDAIILSAPATPDASTGTNAAELRRILRAGTKICALPRSDPADAEARLKPLLAGVA